MSDVSIGIISWAKRSERLGYLERSIRRLRTYLKDHQNICFVCSAETQDVDQNTMDKVGVVCSSYDVRLIWKDTPASIGGNINNLFRNIDTDYMFLAEDDRLLFRELDLFQGVEVLKKFPEVCAVNYSVQYGRKNSCLQGASKLGGFHRVSELSPWSVVNMQILFQKNFTDVYGFYEEDPHLIDHAEREMNVRLKRRRALTLYEPHPCFGHCGTRSSVR